MSQPTLAEVRAAGALQNFPDRELEALLGATDVRRFHAGDTLCVEGTPGASCFILLSGEVEVVSGRPPNERPLATLRGGALVGQVALVDRSPRSATVRARAPVRALELTRDKFEALLRAQSPMALRFQMQIAIASARQMRVASARLTALREAGAQLGRGRPAARPVSVPTPPVRRTPLSAGGAAGARPDDLERYLETTARTLDVPTDLLDTVETGQQPRQQPRRNPYSR